MRTSVVLVLALAALVASSAIPERTRKVAEKDLLQKQKDILKLLIRVNQPTYLPEIKEIADSYDPEAHLDQYKDPTAVKRLLTLWRAGELLPRGKAFSIVSMKLVGQVKLIFEVIFGGNDYQTFIKTSAFLRERVNEAQFVYAFSTAVIHRQDTKDVVLPPPFEIYPELFVQSDIIHEATEEYLQGKQLPLTINAGQFLNQSAWYYTYPVGNPDRTLRYFTDDVGLAAYQIYFAFEYPSWFNPSKYGLTAAPREGETFFYYLQQLLHRYQLERLSHNLVPAYPFVFDSTTYPLPAFTPNLVYHNGVPFPSRSKGVTPTDVDFATLDFVRNLWTRVEDAVYLGAVYDESGNKVLLKGDEGFDLLSSVVKGDSNSPHKKYYGSLYLAFRTLLGHSPDPYHIFNAAPSVLDHYENAARDPAYWRIIARIVSVLETYKKWQKPYTRDELAYPGVKIESVDVDKLITYFDDFDFNINAAVDVPNAETADKIDIRVRQPRLNHKPFSLRITVNSDKAARVGVRVFLGPKFNYQGRPLNLEERRDYFVELDRFPFDLQAGKTTIERSSRESTAVVPDQTITRVLLKKVDDALEGREPFYVDSSARHCGFPERLLLPKGSRQGLPLALYVVISPYEGDSTNTHTAGLSCGAGYGFTSVDKRAAGFPFDRPVASETDFNIPNLYVKDVTVFHKTQEEVNKA